MKKGKFVAVIIAALLISRLPTLFHPFIDVDEALFAIFAKIWQHGGIPYIHAVETKALGVYCFYTLASWLSGSLPEINMVAVHLLTIVWMGLTAWVVGRIASRVANERVGLWAALLFVIFSACFVPKIVAASMTTLLLLPMCIAMDLILRDDDARTSLMSFAAGLMVAAATLIKYQAGIMIFVILGYLWSCRTSWRTALRHSVFFIIGGLPLPAIMLGYLHHLGALQDFWYWNFGGSMHYIASGAGTIDLAAKLKSHVLPYLACTFPIWILTGMQLRQWWRQGRSGRKPLETGVWIWFFLCIIPVCLGKRFYGHYFLILMPQLCILSAMQFVSKRRRWVVPATAILFIATLIPRYYPRPIYDRMHEEIISDYQLYGDYLKSHTQSEDRILVWGFSPAIYWYADRLPATRFLWSDVLVGRAPGLQGSIEATMDFSKLERPELWEMFYADLNAHTPAYIIDMAPTGMHNYTRFPMSRYPRLMDYLASNYIQESDLNGAKVYRRADLLPPIMPKPAK